MKPPYFLEIVSDLNRLELRRHPEVAEEENHDAIENVMQPADCEEVCDLLGSPALRESHVDDRGREEQDGLGENDRHDPRVVDLERHVLRLSAVYLASDDAFCVLDADFALGLGHGDDRRDDENQEQTQQDQHDRAHAGLGARGARNEGAPRLNQTSWELREDTDGDDERDTISDSAFGDLIAQPHQEHRPRRHGNHGHQLKP